MIDMFILIIPYFILMTYAVKSDSQQGGDETKGEEMRSGDVISDALMFSGLQGAKRKSGEKSAQAPVAPSDIRRRSSNALILTSPLCHIACSLAAIQ